MSDPVQVETVLEASLVAAIQTQVTALQSQIPGRAKVPVQGWWQPAVQDSASKLDPKGVEPPCIVVFVSPNVPRGYGCSLRTLEVRVDMVTNPNVDKDGSVIRLLYRAVRVVFDAESLTIVGSGIVYRGHEIVAPGFPGMNENGWHVSLQANYEVDVTS